MKYKYLITSIILSVICVVFSISASAATASDIIAELKSAGATSTQIALAEDYLKTNSFTSAQLDVISSGIENGVAILREYKVTDPYKLPESAKVKLEGIFASTAAKAGISVAAGKNSSNIGTYTIGKGGQNYTFNANDSLPKVTGLNSTLPTALFALGILLVAGSAAYLLILKRNQQFAKKGVLNEKMP